MYSSHDSSGVIAIDPTHSPNGHSFVDGTRVVFTVASKISGGEEDVRFVRPVRSNVRSNVRWNVRPNVRWNVARFVRPVDEHRFYLYADAADPEGSRVVPKGNVQGTFRAIAERVGQDASGVVTVGTPHSFSDASVVSYDGSFFYLYIGMAIYRYGHI